MVVTPTSAYLTWGDAMRQQAQRERDQSEADRFIEMQNNHIIVTVCALAGVLQ